MSTTTLLSPCPVQVFDVKECWSPIAGIRASLIKDDAKFLQRTLVLTDPLANEVGFLAHLRVVQNHFRRHAETRLCEPAKGFTQCTGNQIGNGCEIFKFKTAITG